ncbi:MAG: lipoate--protein ligase family protein [Candidatus Omnitrophota bacterium]|jgi:lipoate-protein ligase A|nr:MAG: lipoate--protein ligase family protein [Candidatus Omnitrophota bacterium]
MAKNWRLILSGPADAYTNMAVDEAIFFAYCEKKAIPTLRLYTWDPPALSLGCAQDPFEELDLKKCVRANIDVVRRISGGGIIFHDQELTYSASCNKEDIQAFGSIADSFKSFCAFLLSMYRTLGLCPVFANEAVPRLSLQRPSVFCFSSCAKYDILIGGKKIGGNAQRRKKDFIFQHGSIPLEFDAKKATSFLKKDPGRIKEKVCALNEAAGREVDLGMLQGILVQSFKETFGVSLDEGELSSWEKTLALRLREEKYSLQDWNLRRHEHRLEEAYVAA